ncbi:unnamed protein product, partial [marine sediment metagenome]
MSTLTYDFNDMTLTLYEPLARHEVKREALNAKILGAWSKENDKPGEEVGDNWSLLYQFVTLFSGVAHVENAAPYMPPIPLPEKPAELLKACGNFWLAAPRSFLLAHRDALADAEALP